MHISYVKRWIHKTRLHNDKLRQVRRTFIVNHFRPNCLKNDNVLWRQVPWNWFVTIKQSLKKICKDYTVWAFQQSIKKMLSERRIWRKRNDAAEVTEASVVKCSGLQLISQSTRKFVNGTTVHSTEKPHTKCSSHSILLFAGSSCLVVICLIAGCVVLGLNLTIGSCFFAKTTAICSLGHRLHSLTGINTYR